MRVSAKEKRDVESAKGKGAWELLLKDWHRNYEEIEREISNKQKN